MQVRLNALASVLAAVTALTVLSGSLSAQQVDGMRVADTSSPRATLRSFLDGCNDLHRRLQAEQFYFDPRDPQDRALAQRILDCIDASEIPSFARENRAGEVAVCLKEIIDRHPLPAWEEIPDLAAIETAGGYDELSRWQIPGTRLTIARVEDGPQKHEYLFTSGTVDRAVDYFAEVESLPLRSDGPDVTPGLRQWYVSTPGHPLLGRIIEMLPERTRFGRTFGVTNWKWWGLLVAIVVSLVLMVLLYRLHITLASRTRGKRIIAYCLTIVFPIAAMLVPLAFEYTVRVYLTVRGNPLYVASFCANVIATLAATVVVFSFANRVAEAIIASPKINPQGLNAQLIRIVARLLSLALAVIVFLVGGQYLGIPLGTLLASAGIGGLAIALGAQDTLKTLFGTLVLMADKPFRVGDRIIVKEYDGIVEDIGLRSTRLRLLTSHLVTVPNDELARIDIENVGRRQCIRRVTDIHIPLDTPAEKVEQAIEIVRSELDDHEGMNPELPPRVFFVDFLPGAFTIRLMYWYHPPHYWDYLALSERLNLAVFHRFEEEGICFSLPQRLTHTSVDSIPAPLDIRVSADSDTFIAGSHSGGAASAARESSETLRSE